MIRKGELSLIENVHFFLDRISLNKNINAYNIVFNDDCIDQAKLIQQKINSGTHGKLAGAVFAIKDVISVKNKPLTCSSKILSNFNSIYDATVVKKIIDEDGIIIGKTNCDEFAMGSSNENSAFGPVLNPTDMTRVSGGSSGGSAAAVAADLCDISIGTDTGGSIRQPAAFCGIYGLKPTYSRVSRYGLTAFASSFDSIGPFAKSVEDIALTLDVISGYDPADSTSRTEYLPMVSEEYLAKKTFRIGLPKEYFEGSLSGEILDCINISIKKLKQLGHTFQNISLPHTEYSIAAYYVLATAEASSNLARFDGVRYGFRELHAASTDEMYKMSRSQGFGDEVKRRIMLGTYVLSSGYYDAYYLKAQKVRQIIKSDFTNAFQEVDLLLTPTTPTTAFKLGEKRNNPLEMYLSDIYTTSANLAGIPAMSIPGGTSADGLPIGIQFMANQFNETSILQVASQLQEFKN